MQELTFAVLGKIKIASSFFYVVPMASGMYGHRGVLTLPESKIFGKKSVFWLTPLSRVKNK